MFEIGEIVRVIEPELDEHHETDGIYFDEAMRGFIGYEFRIESIHGYKKDRCYITDIDENNPIKVMHWYASSWVWHESWLQKVDVYEYDELNDEPELIELLFNEM